jgi:WD40 repeat protein
MTQKRPQITPIIAPVLSLLLLFLAVACQPSGDRTPDPSGRFPTPTVPAPTWIEPAGAITVDNAAQISYLGRLDAPGTPSTIFTYSFSPDGTRLAGLNNEQLLGWDLVTGERVFATGRVGATEVFYAPDKSEIYTLDNEGNVIAYDAQVGVAQNNFQAHSQFSGTEAFDKFNGYLAVGGINGEVKVWDTLARTSLVSIQAHDQNITAMAFSADGTLLATGSDDGTARLWNWRDKTMLADYDHQSASPLRMVFSPDGTQLVTATNRSIAAWSVADKALMYALDTGSGAASDVLLFSPDGQYLAHGGGIPDLNVRSAQTGDLLGALPGVGGDRTSAAFSPDSQLLLTSVLDGKVTLWNMTTIGEEQGQRAELSVGATGDARILYVDWTSDGFLLAFFDSVGPIYMWGLQPTEAAPAS